MLDSYSSGVHREASRSSSSATSPFRGIVGRSPEMREIFARIEKVAGVDANVCIYGESGTGKELIARAIHRMGLRRDRPVITLDCTTIPEGLMESHLFGHVRGAFTGAVENREGLFSLAHGGTLIIDELCELSLPLQAKLLRVIQTREFYRVGGTQPIRTNIRLITATNKDPKHQVAIGEFRADLYYRVAVVMIKVPPLRERREDIQALIEHFLTKFCTACQKRVRIAPSTFKKLLAYSWPGNVRQLENAIEQAVVMAEGDILGDSDFVLDDTLEHDDGAPPSFEGGVQLREVERQHILRTLEMVRGNRTAAAKVLGVSLRCLQYKLKSYLADQKALTVPVEMPQMMHSRQSMS
jgi:DNA-binding NtrC family response regulator